MPPDGVVKFSPIDVKSMTSMRLWVSHAAEHGI
jgi:hypothetical protein